MTKLFCRCIASGVGEPELLELFLSYGTVERLNLARDWKVAGAPSRGFAFVEMPNHDEALAAMEALDGVELHGRRINVRLAEERK